jgi:hypothetical protein
MTSSDFSRACIIGYGSSPSRCGPVLPQAVARETSRFPSKERPHMPGSLTTPGRQALALARLSVLPSTVVPASASRLM